MICNKKRCVFVPDNMIFDLIKSSVLLFKIILEMAAVQPDLNTFPRLSDITEEYRTITVVRYSLI